MHLRPPAWRPAAPPAGAPAPPSPPACCPARWCAPPGAAPPARAARAPPPARLRAVPAPAGRAGRRARPSVSSRQLDLQPLKCWRLLACTAGSCSAVTVPAMAALPAALRENLSRVRAASVAKRCSFTPHASPASSAQPAARLPQALHHAALVQQRALRRRQLAQQVPLPSSRRGGAARRRVQQLGIALADLVQHAGPVHAAGGHLREGRQATGRPAGRSTAAQLTHLRKESRSARSRATGGVAARKVARRAARCTSGAPAPPPPASTGPARAGPAQCPPATPAAAGAPRPTAAPAPWPRPSRCLPGTRRRLPRAAGLLCAAAALGRPALGSRPHPPSSSPTGSAVGCRSRRPAAPQAALQRLRQRRRCRQRAPGWLLRRPRTGSRCWWPAWPAAAGQWRTWR
jgi:hypothetical protein